MGHEQKLNMEGVFWGASENVTLSFVHHCLVFVWVILAQRKRVVKLMIHLSTWPAS